jgi:CRP-like cAMP-binding protein
MIAKHRGSAPCFSHEPRVMDGSFWYLKRCGLFERLADAEAERLNRRALVRRFPRHAIIYAPAEPGQSVLVLVSGRVKIKGLTPEGREAILAFIDEGELFGELALLDGQPRQEFAEAVEDCEVLLIPREDLVELMESRPDLALSVTKLIGLRRLRVESRLRDLLFLSSRDRMARILLELAGPFGAPAGKGRALRLPLTHQDLANLIGVSRETATIALGQLQAEGLIAVQRRRIVIHDLVRLGGPIESGR